MNLIKWYIISPNLKEAVPYRTAFFLYI
jgi:hypothetical protein